jgi:hypothetical protein
MNAVGLCRSCLEIGRVSARQPPEVGSAYCQSERSELQGKSEGVVVPARHEVEDAGDDGAGQLADGESGRHSAQ